MTLREHHEPERSNLPTGFPQLWNGVMKHFELPPSPYDTAPPREAVDPLENMTSQGIYDVFSPEDQRVIRESYTLHLLESMTPEEFHKLYEGDALDWAYYRMLTEKKHWAPWLAEEMRSDPWQQRARELLRQ